MVDKRKVQKQVYAGLVLSLIFILSVTQALAATTLSDSSITTTGSLSALIDTSSITSGTFPNARIGTGAINNNSLNVTNQGTSGLCLSYGSSGRFTWTTCGSAASGGWTNTTTYTQTTLNVNITGNLSVGTGSNLELKLNTTSLYYEINPIGSSLGIYHTGDVSVSDTLSTQYLVITNNTAASCDLKADTNGNVYCGTDANTGSASFSTNGTASYIPRFVNSTYAQNSPLRMADVGVGRLGYQMLPTTGLTFNMSDSTAGTQVIIYQQVTGSSVNGVQGYRYGNSTDTGGAIGKNYDMFRIEGRGLNSSSGMRQSLIIIGRSTQAFDGNGHGSKWDFQATTNGSDSGATQSLTVLGNGVIVSGTNYDAMPVVGARLFVEGNATFTQDVNVSKALRLGNHAYGACTTANAGDVVYNASAFKHYGCNTTGWNALY